MPLVYLDTSHLSLLGRLLADDATRFDAFYTAWSAASAELVFTRTHLVELRQHADSRIREQRYALLERLLPVHSDIITREPPAEAILFQEREILRTFYRLGLFDVQSVDDSQANEWRRQHLDILPGLWTEAVDVQALRIFEQDRFGETVRRMQDATQLRARAMTRPAGLIYSRMKLGNLGEEPVSEEAAQMALRTFENRLSSDIEVSRLLPNMPIDVARELLNSFMEQLRRMILRAREVGIKQAYVEFLGVAVSRNDNPFLDDLSSDLVFRHYVHGAIRILGASPHDEESLSAGVNAQDCPGFWLARSVSLDIRKAEHDPNPSNEFDLDHVMFAPYVDAFFTDKRIASYINNVRRRESTIPTLREMRAPIAITSSTEALIGALEGLV